MNSRLSLITFFYFLVTITAGYTQQTLASGPDEHQLDFLRDHMATHRIFHRLDYLSNEESFKRASILEKIQQGEKAAGRMVRATRIPRVYDGYAHSGL